MELFVLIHIELMDFTLDFSPFLRHCGLDPIFWRCCRPNGPRSKHVALRGADLFRADSASDALARALQETLSSSAQIQLQALV